MLNDICYEQIKDSFHYGKFGEFTLVMLFQRYEIV